MFGISYGRKKSKYKHMKPHPIKYFTIISLLMVFACSTDEAFILEREGDQLVNVEVPANLDFLPDDTQQISFDVEIVGDENITVSAINAFVQLFLDSQDLVSERTLIGPVQGGKFVQNRTQFFQSTPINGQNIQLSNLSAGDFWEISYEIILSNGSVLESGKKTRVNYKCQYNIAGTYNSIARGQYGDGDGGQSGSYEGLFTQILVQRTPDSKIFRFSDITFGLFEIYLQGKQDALVELDCEVLNAQIEKTITTNQGNQVNILFTLEGVFNPEDRSLVINWENSDGDLGEVELNLIN